MAFDPNTTKNTYTPNCEDHNGVQEDLYLIKYELGIKELRNGERDKQIKEAYTRMNQIGHDAEEEDKTLNEKVISLNTRMEVGEVKMASIEMYQKLILAALLTILGAMILFFIEFNWKTFILGI